MKRQSTLKSILSSARRAAWPLAALLLLLATACRAPAASPTETAVPQATPIPFVPVTRQMSVVVDVATLRTGPGLSFEAVGTLLQGEVVAVEGQSEDGAWFKLRRRLDSGTEDSLWISAQFLRDLPQATATLPATSTSAPTPLSSDTPTATPTPAPATLVPVDTPTASATPGPAATDTATPTLAPVDTPTSTTTPGPAATDTATPTLAPVDTPTSTTTPGPGPTDTPQAGGNLAFTYQLTWQLDPNNPLQAIATVDIFASGGTGTYSYFHDDIPQPGPHFTFPWSVCKAKPGSLRVDSGGQSVRVNYFETPPCPPTPTPTP